MVRFLQSFINSSSDFTAIEYALIAALMAVAAMAAIA
jgi:Flp pilus assembly pilin Flp